MTVRLAGPADVPAIGALRRAWVEEQVGAPVDDDGFGAELDGRAVGMLNLLVFTRMPKPRADGSPRSGQWGYVANVYVEQGLRDRGFGQQLLDSLLVYAEAHDLVRLVLSPSERSVPFYARAGFVPATSLMVRERP